jgi:hypothetical protein
VDTHLIPVVVFVRAEGVTPGDAANNGVQAISEAIDAKADRDQERHQATTSGAYPGGGNELGDGELMTRTFSGQPRKVQVAGISTVSAALRSGALSVSPSEARLESTA